MKTTVHLDANVQIWFQLIFALSQNIVLFVNLLQFQFARAIKYYLHWKSYPVALGKANEVTNLFRRVQKATLFPDWVCETQIHFQNIEKETQGVFFGQLTSLSR